MEGTGDLPVAVAARHQAQHVDLAPAQGIGRVEAGEVRRKLAQPPEHARGEPRLDHGAARGHRADGARELIERDVLQQKSLGSGPQAVEHQPVVVEGGEDDRRRKLAAAPELGEHLEPALAGQADVEQHHVGPGLGDDPQSLVAVDRLGGHVDVVHQVEQRAQPLAHQGLIFHQADPDHGVSGRGM